MAELGRLEGRIVDAATGAALPSARARVYRSGEDYPRYRLGRRRRQLRPQPARRHLPRGRRGRTRPELAGGHRGGLSNLSPNGLAACDLGPRPGLRGRRPPAGFGRQRSRLGPATAAARPRRARGSARPIRSTCALHSSDGKLVQRGFPRIPRRRRLRLRGAGRALLPRRPRPPTIPTSSIPASTVPAVRTDLPVGYLCPDPSPGQPRSRWLPAKQRGRARPPAAARPFARQSGDLPPLPRRRAVLRGGRHPQPALHDLRREAADPRMPARCRIRLVNRPLA